MPEENKSEAQEEKLRCDPDQLAMLKRCSEAKSTIEWSKWRSENPGEKIRLQGARLESTNLQNALLWNANLMEAVLTEANLQNAELHKANLQRAYLRRTVLQGARLWRANLQEAQLWRANLQEVFLYRANLQGAVLTGADLRGGILQESNLTGANFKEAKLYQIHLEGAKLIETDFEGTDISNIFFNKKTLCARTNIINCHINPLFKKHVEDGNYLYEFKQSHKAIYWIWWILADCGRSFWRWILWSIGLAIGFGCVFFYILGPDAFKVDYLDWNLSTMLYYSVVTFTTLGFGDIKPMTNEAAWWVMAEVIVGYVMLGGLISILANKLARRS